MYRIDYDLAPPDALLDLSYDRVAALGIKVSYAVARCQHGYTADQTCRDCENGYVTDTHTFANLRTEPAYAWTIDAYSVGYISKRYATKLHKAGY